MKTTIIIEVTEEGKVSMNGPLENKVLCYGLLEVAKDLVRNHQPSPIIKPKIELKPN